MLQVPTPMCRYRSSKYRILVHFCVLLAAGQEAGPGTPDLSAIGVCKIIANSRQIDSYERPEDSSNLYRLPTRDAFFSSHFHTQLKSFEYLDHIFFCLQISEPTLTHLGNHKALTHLASQSVSSIGGLTYEKLP